MVHLAGQHYRMSVIVWDVWRCWWYFPCIHQTVEIPEWFLPVGHHSPIVITFRKHFPLSLLSLSTLPIEFIVIQHIFHWIHCLSAHSRLSSSSFSLIYTTKINIWHFHSRRRSHFYAEMKGWYSVTHQAVDAGSIQASIGPVYSQHEMRGGHKPESSNNLLFWCLWLTSDCMCLRIQWPWPMVYKTVPQ